RGLVETQPTRQRLVELRAVRSLGGMAVLAGHDGIDEITSALERPLRHRRCRSREQDDKPENRATIHALPSLKCGYRAPKRAARSAALMILYVIVPITPAQPFQPPPAPPWLAPVRSPAPSPRRRDRQIR